MKRPGWSSSKYGDGAHLPFAVTLLPGAFVGEGLVGRQLLRVDGALEERADAWLVLLGAAQRSLHDLGHVPLVLLIGPLQVLLLLLRALV